MSLNSSSKLTVVIAHFEYLGHLDRLFKKIHSNNINSHISISITSLKLNSQKIIKINNMNDCEQENDCVWNSAMQEHTKT